MNNLELLDLENISGGKVCMELFALEEISNENFLYTAGKNALRAIIMAGIFGLEYLYINIIAELCK